MANFELANLLSVLVTGRNPAWSQQLGTTYPLTDWPRAAGAGVALQDSPRTRLAVSVRENTGYRTSKVTIGTFAAGATYTITIDGTACAFTDISGVATDTIAGLAVRVNLLAGSTVTASANAAQDEITITSDSSASYYIDISATGAGVLACEADPESCSVDIFWTMKDAPLVAGGDVPFTWYRDETVGTTALTTSGREWLFNTAGKARGFVTLTSIAGHASDGASVTYASPVVFWGPAIQE